MKPCSTEQNSDRAKAIIYIDKASSFLHQGQTIQRQYCLTLCPTVSCDNSFNNYCDYRKGSITKEEEMKRIAMLSWNTQDSEISFTLSIYLCCCDTVNNAFFINIYMDN